MKDLLDLQSILDSVTGDLGEDDYLEPLKILLDALRNEAQLSFFGKLGARYQITNHLQTRAKVNEFLKNKDTEDPSSPIFVMGLPRSGTTFLFNILSKDKDHKSPAFWEMMYPLPLAKRGSFTEKKRIFIGKLVLLFKNFLMPGLNDVHPIEAESPEECILIKTLSLRSLVYVYMANVPTYQSFLNRENFLPAFIWHRRFLQCLEQNEKPKRWLLKDPCHLEHLPEILQIYPNAKFIHIKRDPSETIPSICSLTHKVRTGFSKNVDKISIGESSLNFWSSVLKKYSTDRLELDPNSIIDMKYEDLIADPIGEMHKIYNNFGFHLDTKVEEAMLDYINDSTRTHGGKHLYSAEEFGLTKNLIKQKLSLEN